jgi:hypothetical protein
MNIQQFHSALFGSELVEDLAVLDRLRGTDALRMSEDDGTNFEWSVWPEA